MFNDQSFKLHLPKLSDDQIAWVVQQVQPISAINATSMSSGLRLSPLASLDNGIIRN